MNERLADRVRREASAARAPEERAQRIADVVREESRRRWVGVYRIADDRVVNLAWSGPGAPAYPTFPATKGLTGAAIATRATVVSNDVANDPRYLTALASTGSELIVPVLVGGSVVGTLDVEDEQVGAFSGADRAMFEAVAAAMVPL